MHIRYRTRGLWAALWAFGTACSGAVVTDPEASFHREASSGPLEVHAGRAAERATFRAADGIELVSSFEAFEPAGVDVAAVDPRLPPASLRDNVVYYVMPDRFSNGSTQNDHGDYVPGTGTDPSSAAEIAKHGFDPKSATFFHGGDLIGLRRKLDYIRGLGIHAVWTTPLLRNLAVARDGTQAGYHGYWPVGFDAVDPHFGTAADLSAYVDAAHRRGMKVFFDIILNHSADVIDHVECRGPGGCPFRVSPPYTPFVPPVYASIKSPAWLNDPANYHNLGDTTYTAESMTLGDIGGLDDLNTSAENVAAGLVDLYRGWMTSYGADGFRLDAARHVEDAFLRRFWSAATDAARQEGKNDFFAFGEVHDVAPSRLAHFTAEVGLPSVQDFHFFDAARDAMSRGRPTDRLRALFDDDDNYVAAGSHAGYLVTHLSTHDDGRFGAFLVQDNPAASDAELLARDSLAHALLLTARGIPAIYYGDEQGFTGIDRNGYSAFEAARQDMFPSAVPAYGNPGGGPAGDHTYNKQIGADSTPAADNFDERHPLYRSIRAFTRLRDDMPELRRGWQLHRYSDAGEGGGLFAFSRIVPARNREVVVVFNTSAGAEKSATFTTLHPSTTFRARYALRGLATTSKSAAALNDGAITDADGRLAVTLPPLGFKVLEATKALRPRGRAPAVAIDSPPSRIGLGRFWVSARLSEIACAKVRFFAKEPDQAAYRDLGADENPPYRVAYDGTALPLRSTVSFRAVVTDCWGNQRVSAEVPIVTENRLHDVTVHYQNGNARTSLFSILAGGRIGLPEPVLPAGNVFRWPDGADRVTLFFETPSTSGATFEFDRPIVLRREDVGNFGKLGADGIDADLFVDNAGTVGGAPHDVAALPDVLFADPATPDPVGAPIFLRGEMNGWTTSDPLVYVGAATFAGTTTFASSTDAYAFKIADAAWGFDFGGPFELPHGMTARGSNLVLQIPVGQEGAYRVHFFSFPEPRGVGRLQFYRFEKLAALGPVPRR